MIRKMIAFISAAAIIGTGNAYSGNIADIQKSFAAETAAEKNETCGVTVSVTAFGGKLPEGITAKLISVEGEETTEIASWDTTDTPVKQITGLEYNEEADYRIIFDNKPLYSGFYLPEETPVLLRANGDTDNIVICGISSGLRRNEFSIMNTYNVYNEPQYGTHISSGTDYYEEISITDDNGVRYSCYEGILTLPDGHYTAYVKPAKGCRFVQKFSGSAKNICISRKKSPSLTIGFFEKDLSDGVEFDIRNGLTDAVLDFYVEPVPTDENSCFAEISVVDEDTGELLNGCTVELNVSNPRYNSEIRWKTAEHNPLTIDSISKLNERHIFKVISSPPGYELTDSCTVSFEETGEHKKGVIKMKRIMTDEELAASKIKLPAEDPQPVDKEHCAVTVGIYDFNTMSAIDNGTATLYEYPDDGYEKTELISWELNEEPVKTITDIEYHDNSSYVIDIDTDFYCTNDGTIRLYLKNPGDTDKIAVPLYPKGIYESVEADCALCQASSSTSWISYASSGFNSMDKAVLFPGVYDDKGYRYFFTSGMNSNPVGYGALPDGEYILKAEPAEGYRFITMNSETAAFDMLRENFPVELIAANEENGKNGLRFTVKDGIADKFTYLLVEPIPTDERSCSVDISVVDEVTGEPVEGVDAEIRSYYIPANYLKWNTTDTPVKSFDNLFRLNEKYSVVLSDTPENYSDRNFKTEFSFKEFGEHQDIVIKLRAAGKKGDVNGDGKIDAVDASDVLAYYAQSSTQQESSFTEAQKTAADVDDNGFADSVDASRILEYYAFSSTADGEILRFEDYLKIQKTDFHCGRLHYLLF